MLNAVGSGFTVTVVGALVALQPPTESVIVTVNVPLAITVMLGVVAPLLHKYVGLAAPVLAVNCTLPPAQKVVGPPAVIVTVGCASSFRIVIVLVSEVGLTPVAVTPLRLTKKVSSGSHLLSPT